jgi:hypothetical protein
MVSLHDRRQADVLVVLGRHALHGAAHLVPGPRRRRPAHDLPIAVLGLDGTALQDLGLGAGHHCRGDQRGERKMQQIDNDGQGQPRRHGRAGRTAIAKGRTEQAVLLPWCVPGGSASQRASALNLTATAARCRAMRHRTDPTVQWLRSRQ